ncbi:MAG: sulfatase, partial [Acidobacteriota bacterium]
MAYERELGSDWRGHRIESNVADEFTITRVGLHLQRLVPWLWVGGRWLAAGVLGLAVLVWAGGASAEEAPAEELTSKVAPPSLVLITLDTTRNDFVGPTVEGGASRTPALDRLAGQGVRYRRAVAPSPLTLPSHASLLTGLEPPEHGVRVNGSVALPQDLPTLATLLTAHGFDSAAFVATRVLDRRFGLARGFALYDDRMVAERLGEYGYPERDAAAVTTAALAWTAGRDPVRPFFLWVHYYDPHFPYAAPGSTGGSVHALYADEIAFMDRQIGRLLDGLPATPERIVAVVGDHGESLGEHGERTHGIFLYRSVMEVPLIVAGSGVPRGVQVSEPVATRRLAASLAQLVLPASDPTLPGPVLPGLDLTEIDPPSLPIYSESLMPAATYGWSPLTAVTTVQHRLIVAPRPELYDIAVDPGERRNLVRQERAVARQLRDTLTASEASFRQRQAAPVAADGQL